MENRTIILQSFKEQILKMKGTNPGEFEAIVMLTIASLIIEAYSVTTSDELKRITKRTMKPGVVHAVLHRLEEKGFVKSALGEAINVRGGKRKRFYTVTTSGKSAAMTLKNE